VLDYLYFHSRYNSINRGSIDDCVWGNPLSPPERLENNKRKSLANEDRYQCGVVCRACIVGEVFKRSPGSPQEAGLPLCHERISRKFTATAPAASTIEHCIKLPQHQRHSRIHRGPCNRPEQVAVSRAPRVLRSTWLGAQSNHHSYDLFPSNSVQQERQCAH